ncbi:MAG: sigma-70 family RNA polymerase sigma factor [Aphanocapsa feldmannii 277cV]|uniref:Sigma-70 family RNA polymerase sigma factor n=2 Tax=Aphanocapsa feldmannii TaxID=192050 RepID=A0A524RQ18_9CHRO|nr:MAG: sigma-70 family RNA polymerase sigma factor [Aphanocapsa feldmannii 277cV]TGH20632.1 MAG: sigma-70 family RNA polymerase sigma factor [Aphanocapsa feldmannii 277cI]
MGADRAEEAIVELPFRLTTSSCSGSQRRAGCSASCVTSTSAPGWVGAHHWIGAGRNPVFPKRVKTVLPAIFEMVMDDRSIPVSTDRPAFTMAAITERNQHLFRRHQQLRHCQAASASLLRSRNRLVTLNWSLVKQVASRMLHRSPLPFDDLVQIGSFGLIRAVERFNPDNGTAFSSFAVPLIRGEILHFLRDHAHPLRSPRRLRELHSRGRKLQQDQGMGRMPSLKELCRRLGVSLEHWQAAEQLHHALRLRSLDGPAQPGEEERGSLVDLLPAPVAEEPVTPRKQLQLQRLLANLPVLQRQLLQACVIEGRSQRDVARSLGITPSRVSRSLRASLAELRGDPEVRQCLINVDLH